MEIVQVSSQYFQVFVRIFWVFCFPGFISIENVLSLINFNIKSSNFHSVQGPHKGVSYATNLQSLFYFIYIVYIILSLCPILFHQRAAVNTGGYLGRKFLLV